MQSILTTSNQIIKGNLCATHKEHFFNFKHRHEKMSYESVMFMLYENL